MPRLPAPRVPRFLFLLAAAVALAAVLLALRQTSPSFVAKLPPPSPTTAGHVASARPAPDPIVALADPSATRTAPPPALNTALLDWTARYLAVPVADRPTLLEEGLALARARRPLLAALIRTDPEAALAATFPRALRAQLPAEIGAELEQLVSARAELALIQTCFHPPGAVHEADDLHRATVLDGREYRVHVYGSRLRDGSLPATSLIGIALDGHLAASDSRLRVLEAGEPLPAGTAAPAAGELAVEADGAVRVLPSAEALPSFAASLVAAEKNPVVNEADAGAGSSTVTGRPTQAWTHGAKALLVILVDFPDLPGAPVNKFDGNAQITPAYIDNVINGTNGVRAFHQGSSYGKTDILFNPATDVTGVLRMPQDAAYYATGDSSGAFDALLHSDARAAATTAGFSVFAYDRVAVVFSNLGSFSGSKITYGGLANVVGANLWVNGEFDLRVVGHELGHTHGLRHANLWKVTDGNPVSLATGSSLDYGDPFDLMGDGDFFENDFSHWNKSLLQWIPDSAVTVAAVSGTYRVHRFDASAADLTAPRALKIVRDTTRDYWIGYRRGLTSTATDNGAYVLWGYNSATQGNLLDLVTPGASAADAPLPLNTTFNDSAAGIALRPVVQGGSGADEWLDIQVTLQPRIQWTASSYVVNEQGGSAVLTATRSANSTGNVTVSYATAPGTATAGADYTHTTGTLSWADGDSSAKTITIPITADALVEGTETFTVTLSSPSGGVVVDPATTTVTIADPGARDPGFAANFVNSTVYRAQPRPNGSILIAGAFTQLQATGGAIYNYGRIARLNSSGAIDPDFNPGTGANNTIYALACQPDGKILIGGNFTSFNGTTRNRLARLNADGSLDLSFNPGAGADDTVYDILVQPDGKILVGGAFDNYDGTARNGLVRLLSNGARDTSFADFTGPVVFWIRSLALQTDGKILVAGAFYHQTGNLRAGLKRLTTTGAVDSTFTGLTSGSSTAFDTAFLGIVNQVAVLPDGRILVAGDFSQFNGSARAGVARLTTAGALDSGFTPALNSIAYALLPLPDGRVLLGGDFTTVNGGTATRIARILSDGSPDTAFAAAGGHGATVENLALQPDGNVLLAGAPASFQGASSSRPVWRLVPGLAGTPGTLQFAADAYSAVEGSSATLSVTRSGGSLGTLTVGYATVADTATAGADFTAASGTLTWADGDTAAKTITVPIPADASADTPETFAVNLGAPLIGGALLGDRQQATVTLSTAFGAWQAAHFTSVELADTAVSDDAADPDGDGLNNLAEFALGRDPRVPDAEAATPTTIQNISGTNYLTISFRRRTPALDLAYAVQSSGDLTGAWSTDAVQVGSAVSNGDGTETVTYRDSLPANAGSRRFLRVLVTRTP